MSLGVRAPDDGQLFASEQFMQYLRHERAGEQFKESVRTREANKRTVEAQNFDATVHEGVEIVAARREKMPEHAGTRPRDNRELVESLRRSYLRLGNHNYQNMQGRWREANRSEQAKEQYKSTRKEFRTIREFS